MGNIKAFCKEFGVKVAVEHYMYRLMKKTFTELYFKKRRDNAIIQRLLKENMELIEKYKKLPISHDCICEDAPIWILWWQDYEDAPDLVKSCIESIKINSGNRPVNVISKNNYYNYISFPNYILDKFQNGLFSITHFSDLIRMQILSEYGGIWMDATLYVRLGWDSTLCNYSFYTNKLIGQSQYVSNGEWSSFFLCSCKGGIIPLFARDVFLQYWKKHNLLIDYALIDYILRLCKDFIEVSDELFDKCPLNNADIYKLQENINNTLDEVNIDEFDAYIFKLSNKTPNKEIINGKKTVYGYLVSKR